MSRLSAKNEITAKLKTIGNLEVFEGRTTEQIIRLDNEHIGEFATVNYGSLVKPRKGTNGITGARQSSNIMEFTIRTVANSYDNCERIMQVVFDTLVGFEPVNCGEIDTVLYGGIGEISSLGNPTRYASVQSFGLMVNSDLSEIPVW